MVEGEGFEPSKAEPADLQSDPFDRSGTPPLSCPSPDQLAFAKRFAKARQSIYETFDFASFFLIFFIKKQFFIGQLLN